MAKKIKRQSSGVRRSKAVVELVEALGVVLKDAEGSIRDQYEGTTRLEALLAELDGPRAVWKKYGGATSDPFDHPVAELSAGDTRLIAAYLRCGERFPVAELPYTVMFNQLFDACVRDDDPRTRHALYYRLWQLEQAGRLTPVTQCAPLSAPDVPSAVRRCVLAKYQAVTKHTPREQLPYSPTMERLVSAINGEHKNKWYVGEGDVWRLTRGV